MATDLNAVVHIKDENGNVNNIFPATKIGNVEGLQSALNAKANSSDVTSGLALKVDKEAGKGLSTNDYTTAEKNKLAGIEAQANKTVVDSALSSSSTNPVQNKVINTALGNKADASTVSALATTVSGKADASAVTSLTSRVSQNETDINTQAARIDEIASLPSGSTSGDAELMDIRIKTDGTTATNAGTAVREQISVLNKMVSNVLTETTLTDNSIINYQNGQVQSGVSGYAVTDYIPIDYGSLVSLAFVRGKDLCGGAVYDENKNYLKTIWGTDNYVKPSTNLNAPFSFINDDFKAKYIRYTLVANSIYPRINQYLLVTESKDYLKTISPYKRTLTSSNLNTKYSDLDTVDINSIMFYNTTTKGLVAHAPDGLNSFLLLTYNYDTLNYGGAVQFAVADGANRKVAYRFNNGSSWTEWIYPKYYENEVFDFSTLTENSIIDYQTGNALSGYNGYAVTDYIPVNYGDSITLAFVKGKDLCAGAVYDENKNFIKAIWGTNDWKRPSSEESNLNSSFSFIVDSPKIKYIRYNVVTNTEFRRYNQSILLHNSTTFKKTGNYFTVGEDGDFTKLKDCTEYISTNHIENATVFVKPGTYNLVDEFGSEYLENLDVSGNVGVGLQIGYNTHYIFAENALVRFIYDGDNLDVCEHFSAFNVVGSFTLENADIVVQNARYCVHDDLPTSAPTVPSNCESKYINCRMQHLGNTKGEYIGTVAIGAGVHQNTTTIVDGGVYICGTQFPYALSWHNANTNKKSRIVLKNVYVNNGIRLHEQSANGNTVDVEISGCYAPNGLGGTHSNLFNITEWNNSFSS